MINITVVGKERVVQHLEKLPTTIGTALRAKMLAIVLRLQAHIQRDKLSGQVLNVQTGALRRSITQEVMASGDSVVGRVFSSGDVKYAAIHEFGGRTKAHVIEPRKAEALAFMMGGKMVFAKKVNHPGSVMPERSFMRSSLADMKTQIIDELMRASLRAARGEAA